MQMMTILSKCRFYGAMTLATFVVFVAVSLINLFFFKSSEYVPGIDWVYLPAGVRLLATLLFGLPGAIGLLLAGWCMNFWIQFPDDFGRSFMGGIVSAAAPYMVYLVARRFFGLKGSLENLTPAKLFTCIVMYSLASPLMHHIWFEIHGTHAHDWTGFYVMALGDFLGSVIVIYTLKMFLGRGDSKLDSTPMNTR